MPIYHIYFAMYTFKISCETSKGNLKKNHTKFWSHTSRNVCLNDLFLRVIYNIFELWIHKPQWDGPVVWNAVLIMAAAHQKHRLVAQPLIKRTSSSYVIIQRAFWWLVTFKRQNSKYCTRFKSCIGYNYRLRTGLKKRLGISIFQNNIEKTLSNITGGEWVEAKEGIGSRNQIAGYSMETGKDYMLVFFAKAVDYIHSQDFLHVCGLCIFM